MKDAPFLCAGGDARSRDSDGWLHIRALSHRSLFSPIPAFSPTSVPTHSCPAAQQSTGLKQACSRLYQTPIRGLAALIMAGTLAVDLYPKPHRPAGSAGARRATATFSP